MKTILYYFFKLFGRLIPNILFSNILFFINCVRLKKPYYFLNIRNPKTFNEKINFIKYYNKNHLAPIVADKFAVRDFITKKIGSQYLVPLIAIFDNPEQIDFSILPEQFVMKLNNGSGFNLICNNKNALNMQQVIREFISAYKNDIYSLSREWHYKQIRPKIIVEQFLGSNINDYKILCDKIDGPVFVQVDVDRFHNHKRNIYDLEWNKMDITYVYPNIESIILKPVYFSKMLKLAKILSSEFLLSRIDFYEVNNNIYFGEITLHPEGGMGPMDSYNSDLKLGQLINRYS